jgi:di/tricarboxylate transporter
MEQLGFFEITILGLPVAAAGVALLLLVAPVLLPRRLPARTDLEIDVREFVIDMTVVHGGPLDGVTVEAGGLRHLRGVFLVQIDRESEDHPVAPVGPETFLRGGDRLRFVGRVSDVVDLHTMRGLEPSVQEHLEGFDTSRLGFFEAVVGQASPLVGRTLKESGFRGRYSAAVVAIHRSGQRVQGKLGDIRLRNGDTLLVVAAPGFRARFKDSNEFLLVSRLDETDPVRSDKAPITVAVGLAVVVAAATGLADILVASLLGVLALILLGVLTPTEARGSLDMNVLVVIASSFGLGAAVESTGLAETIAGGIIDGLDGMGTWAVVLGIVLATVVLTELVTNNAAAVLMFPVALAVSTRLDVDPRGLAMAVAVAASASFLTPIGYQTNTMVWGPGGYRFGDYSRLGAPLTVLSVAVIVAITTARLL